MKTYLYTLLLILILSLSACKETTISVSSVRINPTELTLEEGETKQLSATIEPADATNQMVRWSSSRSAVASVYKDGLVTAVSPGTAVITVTTADGGYSATCTVTVTAKIIPVTGITINESFVELTEGETCKLEVTVNPANATDKSVTWSTSDDKVATVKDGKVTAIAEGTATITAAAGAQSATCEVTVSKKIIHVTSIELDRTSMRLAIGESDLLVVRVLPDDATDKTYTWSSTNSSIAEVDAAGKVTAKSEGTVTITATTTDGGLMAGCEVTVYNPVIVVTSITLDKSDIALVEGESFKLTAIVKPDDATDKTVTWTTSDASVADVQNGVVTAIKEGMATITASSGAQRATCLVTVAKKIIPVESVTLDRTELNLIKGATATLSATVVPSDATNLEVSWASSDESVASVKNGVVTAKKSGHATITATAENASATCAVTVTNPATGISLDRASAALTEGEYITLKATVRPADADDKTVSWTSSNTNVATVDNNGKVMARAEGTATITATCGAFKATCTVTVNKKIIHVTGIELDRTNLRLAVGTNETIEARVLPENATDKSYTWASSNPAIASVDDSGKVSAKAAGTVTITATATDGGITAACEVTVFIPVIPVESITLDKTKLELIKGSTATLSATVKPDNATNKAVTWTSSDPAIVTVDDSGKVTAVNGGSAVVTASAGGKSATCLMTVTVLVESIVLDRVSVSLEEGQSTILVATISPSNASDKSVSWSSDNPSVADVDNNGKVTAKAEGSATISASNGNKVATCRVTVMKKVVPVASVTLNTTYATLLKEEHVQLTATVQPADATDKDVTWSSSDATIASVDQNGLVTAHQGGNVIIIAKAGEKSAYCEVSVYVPVESVSLNKTSASLILGETLTLTATLNPSDATYKNVVWSTSDSSIATVVNGVVTANNVGTAIITAIVGDKSATCTITVEPIRVTGVTLDKATASLIVGETTTMTATITPANSTNKKVSWSSNKTSVATVDNNGTVTATGPGSATITVTTEDGGYTANCNVTVIAPVTGVSLNESSITLNEGSTETLVATITPANASNMNLNWGSSNTSVATVDNNGIVTAKLAGSATITVTTEDGGYTATCAVTVIAPVSGIGLDKTSLTLTEGDGDKLTATISPANATNKNFSWESNNTNVATVDQNGNVSAVAPGSATITVATEDGGYTASCSITVAKRIYHVTGITLNKSQLNFIEGQSETLVATVTPSNATDKSVGWRSSNTAVATVDNSGKVTAVSAGTATITATTTDGGYTATCAMTVTAPVTGVTLNKTSLSLEEGNAETLVATITPANATNKAVTWTSNKPDVATVDASGKVTAVDAGSATITVKTDDGDFTATCAVTVKAKIIAVTGITLDQTELTLMVNTTATLVATIVPANATNKGITWSSNKPGVATVDATGKVTAVGVGTATITVKTADGGYIATCQVTVSTEGLSPGIGDWGEGENHEGEI